jgi:hypothetical protein
MHVYLTPPSEGKPDKHRQCWQTAFVYAVRMAVWLDALTVCAVQLSPWKVMWLPARISKLGGVQSHAAHRFNPQFADPCLQPRCTAWHPKQ